MEGFVRSPREPGGLETSNADVFEVHHVAQSRQINALNPAGTERAPTEKAMQRYAGKKAPRPSAAVARQVRAQKQSAEKRKGSIEQDAERATEAGSADVTSNARVTTQGPIAEVEEDEAYQVWGTKAFKVREVRRRSSGNGTRNGNGNGNARRPSLDLSKVQSAPMEDQENIHVLGEVSSRLLGAQKKNGVVAVKVKEFSFADEALERAVPPPPRYPHQPRKKVQRKGPGQTGSFSRATSVWDEKSGELG